MSHSLQCGEHTDIPTLLYSLTATAINETIFNTASLRLENRGSDTAWLERAVFRFLRGVDSTVRRQVEGWLIMDSVSSKEYDGYGSDHEYAPSPVSKVSDRAKRPRSALPDAGDEFEEDNDLCDADEGSDDVMMNAQKAEQEAKRESLLAVSGAMEVILEVINKFNRESGYPPLHQDRVREHAAYFLCGCRLKDCVRVILHRAKADKKRSKAWSIKSMTEGHACEPLEPMGIAVTNTFIPAVVKLELLRLFDANAGASQAHQLAITFASQHDLPTTWRRDDVKNFFRALRDRGGAELMIILDDLTTAGHYVAIDWSSDALGKRVLNRFLIVTRAMAALFQLYSACCLLDSTYGKNNLMMPMQAFIGLSSENCIVVFAIGSTRSETAADFEWLLRAFYSRYLAMPRTWITDGDAKIYDSIAAVACENNLVVSLLLCVWHLFNNIERQLTVKKVVFDPVLLKSQFYSCRAAISEAEFNSRWASFVAAFGIKEAARTYLEKEILSKRKKWCLAWIDSAFHGLLMTTSPSESFHALLASGKSVHRSMPTVLKVLDGIVMTQTEEHQKRCASWDVERQELVPAMLQGMVLPSVVQLLSGRAFRHLIELDVNSSRFKVQQSGRHDVLRVNSWTASNPLYPKSIIHNVDQIDPSGAPLGPSARAAGESIKGALARPGSVDVGL